MTKRVVLYVRVSSEMQLDNYSLDAQESACQSFARLKEWKVVKTFREEGGSAKSLERPIFQEMIRFAESGACDIILVHKLDRFSRKLKDMIGIIDYFEDFNVALVSATEQFDLSTSQGKMMVNVMGSVNQWYLDNLAEEISKGKRQRAKSGDWNGTLSYGYTTPSRLEDELSVLSGLLRQNKINPDEFRDRIKVIEETLEKYPDAHETQAIPHYHDAKGVLLAYEQYATGQYSAAEIANLLNESGYHRESRDGSGLFAKDMIGKLLKNRFYLGETSYGAKVKGMKRKWMQGNHDAIISPELFARCQAVRKASTKRGNKNAHNRKRPYPLSPMMVCVEHEIRWRGHFQDGRRRYLRKRNNGIPGTHVKADEIENQLIEMVASVSIPKDWKSHVVKSLRQNEKLSHTPKSSVQKLERLQKLFVLGHISEEKYLKQHDKIHKEIQKPATNTIGIDELETIEAIMKDLKTLWSVATLEEKDQLAKMLFHKIYMREKEIAAVEPTAILCELIRAAERTGFEPA